MEGFIFKTYYFFSKFHVHSFCFSVGLFFLFACWVYKIVQGEPKITLRNIKNTNDFKIKIMYQKVVGHQYLFGKNFSAQWFQVNCDFWLVHYNG